MSPVLPVCAFFFILLVHSSGAKPASDPLTLKQPRSSEELQAELETEVETETEMETEEEAEGQSPGEALLGEQLDSTNWALQKDEVLMRLLKDLLRTSRRSWRRHKKGGLRSCFGVRLARIGSFSGLGC
ncbi:unnamed protein product [Tetraodon nigroviridis]|uniref:(spotted green pufferfish) hypothetical protein n=1 Tax=Tetraodon nigroviridis TaxID=99883 RepID=Q4T954_TETNG|nr:unnamed protein product [Tetraodon nigroviridis]